MTALVSTNDEDFALIEQVAIQGDLSKLNPQQRVTYYNKVCNSMGLNPFTKPFDYINLGGKLTLYARKDATEQLRKLNGVSIERLDSRVVDDLYIVTAVAKDKHGRIDQSTGAVSFSGLKGDAKANAIMKAETKAKRRVTLSISGMGWLDETEIETIPNVTKPQVNLETGELIDNTTVARKINQDQADDLENVLNGCDPKYKNKLMAQLSLKHPPIKRLEDLPEDLYSMILESAKTARNNYQKRLNEKPKEIEIEVENE